MWCTRRLKAVKARWGNVIWTKVRSAVDRFRLKSRTGLTVDDQEEVIASGVTSYGALESGARAIWSLRACAKIWQFLFTCISSGQW